MTWDYDTWVKVWGWNAPLGVGDNDGFPVMPKLPEGYGWLVTRELTGEHPTYQVMLHQGFSDPDESKHKVLARGKIDKKMYGEAGVLELARSMKEKHCARRPDRTAEAESSRRRPPQGGGPD